MNQAEHRTIVVVDVAGFGDHRRTNEHQKIVRKGMYSALQGVLDHLNILRRCDREDRGDGVFVLVRPDVSKAIFVENFPQLLVNRLKAHNRGRPAEEQIRLRMSLHAGEVNYDEHGVSGVSVNLAFRLIEASQLKEQLDEYNGVLAMIVSSWFYEEVVKHSSASNPSSYRQVQVEVKETNVDAWICLPDQPHLGAARRTRIRQTLPRDVPAFVGRKSELALLLEFASSLDEQSGSAVYAIDGMAGVGKTTLAVHVAHLLTARFPDGQLFVRLHAHNREQRRANAVDVLTTLLSAVGVGREGMTNDESILAGRWRNYLLDKKVLLILDDAAGYWQVEPLLPSSSPGSLVLVTSRRRLTALAATGTVSLSALSPDEAVNMFVHLSGRTAAGADAEHVAEIVRLGGFLPLAIAIVAVRLRHHSAWSIADLAADLSSTRGRLLEFRSEGIEVAAAFDLSYRNLPAAEQHFFCSLAKHPGPELEVYSASALANVPASRAREYLDTLYNDHLLVETAPGRFRMLDIVREYVQMRIWPELPDDRGEAMSRLFASYQQAAHVAEECLFGTARVGADFAALAGSTANFPSALAWMRTERANLVACVEYAESRGVYEQVVDVDDALISFLFVNGPWDQTMSPRRVQRGDPLSRAHALHWRGRDQLKRSNFSAAIDSFVNAVEIYQGLALSRLRKRVATTLSLLGIARLVVGDFPGAINAQNQALEIFRNLRYKVGIAYIRNELGVAYRMGGDFGKAIQEHSVAADIVCEVDGKLGTTHAFALVGLGSVQRATGEIRKSVHTQEQALEIYRALGFEVGVADALDELGASFVAAGDFVKAGAHLRQALEIYSKLGHQLGKAETHNNLGALLLKSGKPQLAIVEHRSALDLAKEVHGLLENARALEGIANCELELDQLEGAVSHLRQAVSIYVRIGAAEAPAATRLLGDIEGDAPTRYERA